MKKKYKGFIPPVIEERNYILGAGNVPEVVLQENSDWTDFLPKTEKQNIAGLETYNCTSFNTLNAIEILMFRLFKEKHNYSDRFVGIMAGTTEGGNDPHTVCEAIRKYGLIPEEMLPFSEDIKTIDEYYSFNGADKEACLKAGQDWLAKYDFKHEYVFSPSVPLEEKLKAMKLALKYSPLGISVFAWGQDERGVCVSFGQENHWTSKYAMKDKLSKIYDSYDPFLKLVEQNYSFVKRFYIKKKDFYPEKTTNWMTGLLVSFARFLKAIFGL